MIKPINPKIGLLGCMGSFWGGQQLTPINEIKISVGRLKLASKLYKTAIVVGVGGTTTNSLIK